MRVLVTGGAGFIGSHVVERLIKRGDSVVVVDNFNNFYNPEIKRRNLRQALGSVDLIELDICNDADLKSAFQDSGRVDAIIHLAARAGVRPSILDPQAYIDTNVTGTLNMLEAARNFDVKRFVFGSSSSVYGTNSKVPFSETDPLVRTISPYATTKLAGEQLCANYAELYGLEVACLRFFTVYGPRQRPDLAIAQFVHRLNAGQPINRYGLGHSSRDYTYVSDIVDGILASMDLQQLGFEIVNLGGSEPVSLNELISTIEDAVGKPAIINQMPEQAGDVPRTYADLRRAKELLGYEPKVRLKDGIASYVDSVQRLNRKTEKLVPA